MGWGGDAAHGPASQVDHLRACHVHPMRAEAQAPQDQDAEAVTDLAARAVHCCYGGHWPSRLGGIAALERLIPALPEAALPRLAPMIVKAVFAVLRILPEHAREEQELGAVLQAVLRRCSGSNAAGDAAAAQASLGEGNKVEGPTKAPVPVVSPPACTPASEEPSASGSPADALQLPALLKQLMEIFVQHLLSSRSSLAVRAVASAGLEVRHYWRQPPWGQAWIGRGGNAVHPRKFVPLQAISNARATSVATLLKPIVKALDSILDRRLLPIRSITAQVCRRWPGQVVHFAQRLTARRPPLTAGQPRPQRGLYPAHLRQRAGAARRACRVHCRRLLSNGDERLGHQRVGKLQGRACARRGHRQTACCVPSGAVCCHRLEGLQVSGDEQGWGPKLRSGGPAVHVPCPQAPKAMQDLVSETSLSCRETETLPGKAGVLPEATSDGTIKFSKLRERLLKASLAHDCLWERLRACMMLSLAPGPAGDADHCLACWQVLIMELGSPHDGIIGAAKAGVLLALEHNMLPKPILQEALRWVALAMLHLAALDWRDEAAPA